MVRQGIAGTVRTRGAPVTGTVRIGSVPQRVVVDEALDETSENPVQNKVVTKALGGKADVSEVPAIGTASVLDVNALF